MSFDPGLFGPASVTWRIHEDPAMVLGGLRALMLQALHPLAMAGVAQHSTFRSDPWGRWFRTGEYLATITYGTMPEVRLAGARVRAVHERLRGVEPESGVAYRVSDPELLLWVHCAEIDSFLSAYRRCGGRLTSHDADAYVAEQVAAARLVGIPRDRVPSTAAALQDYFERMCPTLRATAAAVETVRFGLAPPLPVAARPAWAALVAIAFGLLPAWARAEYGVAGALSAHPGTDLAALLAGRSVASLVRLVPAGVRESPARRAALARMQPAVPPRS